jgi:hypothetical protein
MEDEKAPFLGSWRNIYLLLILVLLLVILLLHSLTQYYL